MVAIMMPMVVEIVPMARAFLRMILRISFLVAPRDRRMAMDFCSLRAWFVKREVMTEADNRMITLVIIAMTQ